MNSNKFVNLAEKIIDGYIPDVEEYRTIASVPENHVFHPKEKKVLHDIANKQSISLCSYKIVLKLR